MASDGSGLRRLTNDAFKDRIPQWAKDSNTIYFLSNRNGHYDVWRIERDGGGLQQVTQSSADTPEIVLGPDPNRAAVFFRSSTMNRAFAMYDLTQPLPLRNPDWIAPIDANHALIGETSSWSSDGRFLAGEARTERETLPGVWVYSMESRHYEKITDNGSIVGWYPDNRTIFFRDGDRLFIVDRVSKATREVSVIPTGFIGFQADGRSIYVATRDVEGDIWMLEYESPKTK
jgi:Tol biopolymer transport system component